ncbi:hypothetical protein MP638_007145 [Amoeboaphelidium occidentale]|nr:hypothetical protein MP638_007145 [Amoeboaphelidium occidentale]
MEFSDVLTNQPVVIDNGSGLVKAGFAGTEEPICSFPSLVGRPKHTRIMAGALEGDHFIGKRVSEHRGLLKLNYPISHGIITNWDEMERIWQHIYSEELKTLSEEHPVLLTEAPYNPRKHRDMLAQIFFETFNVPALFVSIQAVLSLYSSGRTTGVVLDCGDGVCHVVPVYEGFSVMQAVERIDLGGRDITERLRQLLRRSGHGFYTSSEFEVVRSIKEQLAYCSLNPLKEERDFLGYTEDFVLPDGQVIKLGNERFQAPEILFKPELVGKEFVGIHELLSNSISKVDMDLRRNLYSNIVLSGGTTLTKGFGDRLLSEVKKTAQRDVKIKIYAPPERKYSTWIGGSILASLSTFKKMWVSAEEYQEDPDLIHKKMY